MWDEWGNDFEEEQQHQQQQQEEEDDDSYLKFDFLSVLSKPKVFMNVTCV